MLPNIQTKLGSYWKRQLTVVMTVASAKMLPKLNKNKPVPLSTRHLQMNTLCRPLPAVLPGPEIVFRPVHKKVYQLLKKFGQFHINIIVAFDQRVN
jgi:hypothetical protein